MTTPAERKAMNEGAFRDANEELERRANSILGGDDGQLVPFLASARTCTARTSRC